MKAQVHICRNIDHPLPVVAWLIMIFQGMNPFKESSYSHMAISHDGKFYDASGSGCKSSTEENFLKKYKIVDTHTLEKEVSQTDFYEWFKIYEGRKYDRLQIFGLLLKFIGLISFNTIGHNFKKIICNELIVTYLAHFYNFQYKDSDNFDLINTWNKVREF